ncbi:MAG: helix-turn-helix domain-containing protein [Lachnospiraceae bacterium]
MKFCDKLNEYVVQIGCTNKELAAASGLGQGTISRYRNGERTPNPGSEQIIGLATGLAALAKGRKIRLQEEEILKALSETVNDGITVDYRIYISNLGTLLDALNINNNELARELNYDPSYISRILSGQRHPAEIRKFTADIAAYIVRCYGNERNAAALSALFGCKTEDIRQPQSLFDMTVKWLGSNEIVDADKPIRSFLDELDSFNLDEYIQAIHFDDIKVPVFPFYLPTIKYYTGLEEMMDSELDFIKATVLSRSMDDLILYSDMPMEEMAKDPEFPKKWMFGMAMLLKKGLHLNIIHDVNRPFKEMMLGLESHIPMYMTGQISPYYMRSSQSGTFLHLLKVSGTAALSGEAISGHHEKGRYTLTRNKEDVSYFRERAEELLGKALPLMQIYRSNRKQEFESHFKKLWQSGDRRIIFSSLPVFTISEELLVKILDRNGISADDAARITAFHREYLSMVTALLKEHMLVLEVPHFTDILFAQKPPHLELSEMFFGRDIPYSKEEYEEHLQQTKAFTAQYENCILKIEQTPVFRNITLSIIEGSCVVVSKEKNPVIHFIIHHPKMVQAFRDFIPPIIEPEETEEN